MAESRTRSKAPAKRKGPTPSAAKKAAARKPSAAAPPEVSAASAWEQKAEETEGHLLELPSGLTAKLRRTLDLPQLLKHGKIPNPLATSIDEMLKEGRPVIRPPKGQEAQHLVQLATMVRDQLPRIFVDPPIAVPPEDWNEIDNGKWKPPSGFISLDWVGPDDAMFAFAFAQGGPSEVATFREEQAKAMASLADEQGVEGASEQPAGVGG